MVGRANSAQKVDFRYDSTCNLVYKAQTLGHPPYINDLRTMRST
jgi:hypothetical protein